MINAGNSSFKATAGLHNAVRHTDAETGFTHHGFLNLLVATAPADRGAARPTSRCTTALELDRRQGAGRGGAGLTEHEALAVRGVFASYGSCSLTDPVADLEELGLL